MFISVFCKSCEPEIVFVLICILAKQFHGRKSYKTCESTLLCIGNLEENIDLSYIHLISCTKKANRNSLKKVSENMCWAFQQYQKFEISLQFDDNFVISYRFAEVCYISISVRTSGKKSGASLKSWSSANKCP